MAPSPKGVLQQVKLLWVGMSYKHEFCSKPGNDVLVSPVIKTQKWNFERPHPSHHVSDLLKIGHTSPQCAQCALLKNMATINQKTLPRGELSRKSGHCMLTILSNHYKY